MTALQIILWPVWQTYIYWQRLRIKWNDLRALYLEFKYWRLEKRVAFLRKQVDDLKARL